MNSTVLRPDTDNPVRVPASIPERALNTFGVTTEERIARIRALDLSKIRRSLVTPKPNGGGWTEERADEGLKWYRRFLETTAKFPDVSLVPGKDIDDVWHVHIMHTRLYGRDSEHCLGYFLHHTPYGVNDQEIARLMKGYRNTHDLYRLEYGELPPFQAMSHCCSGDCTVNCYSGG